MTSPLHRRAAAALAFAAALLCATRGDDARPEPPAGVAVCFAPGTPRAYMEEVEARAGGDAWTLKAFAVTRWSATAIDGFGLAQGDPTTLTWAIVPDGTIVPAGLGGGSGPSDLRAFLNGIYGSESKWLPLFEKVFARWHELTGLSYVHETVDDGTPLSGLTGKRGVRADVRIGGRAIDGNYGVLAYNSYPDDGDMVLDTTDAWFKSTVLESRRLRNVVGHEHGHGIGLDHACPINGTKLMEPSVSTAFGGPQHDDVLGAQRLYGDPMEPNDSLANATDLGTPSNESNVSVSGVGVDDAGDTDLFAFTVALGTNVDVTLRPFGLTFALGPESSGACGTSSQVDTRARADLRLAVLNPDGSLVAAADAALAGGTESLVDVPLPHGAGRYFVRVRNAGEQLNQMYTLDLVAGQRGEKPVAAADQSATWEVTPVETAVLVNDAGLADVPLRVRVTAPPSAGKAIVDGDRVVFVPARGFTGEARFTYEVRDIHTETSTAEVAVTVRASARAGDARVDADGDGYPDEFETARGSLPNDAGSTPGEDLRAGAAPLVVDSLRLTLRSNRASSDEIVLSGRLPVADGFEPQGVTVVASVAGVARQFVLDATGRSLETATEGKAAPALRLRLKRKRGRVVAGDVRFDLRLSNREFAALWTDEGLATSRRQTREPRAATVIVLFDGRTRIATAPLVFTATKAVSGVARLAK